MFTAIDLDEGWFGLRFINSATEDQLKYCTIEYATKDRTRGGGFENLFGGAILCSSSEEDEPGFGLITSPTIDSCLITRNYARTGGAIMCYDGAMRDHHQQRDYGQLRGYGRRRHRSVLRRLHDLQQRDRPQLRPRRRRHHELG